MCGDDAILYCKCDLASELESDLRGFVNWDRKWHVNFNSEKTQLIPGDSLDNSGATGIKMDRYFRGKVVF